MVRAAPPQGRRRRWVRFAPLIHSIGVPPCPPPRLEGTVPLPDGRRLGYAEYGDPNGPLVLWFHGTPGGRRQIPLVGRRAASELGLRLVCVERPGVGDSTDHAYARILDWAADAAEVADHLGHERFMIVGLSGGGPTHWPAPTTSRPVWWPWPSWDRWRPRPTTRWRLRDPSP